MVRWLAPPGHGLPPDPEGQVLHDPGPVDPGQGGPLRINDVAELGLGIPEGHVHVP